MKHMKKIMALFLSLLLLFALASCGDSSSDDSSTSDSSASDNSNESENNSSDGETKTIKIGHICDQTGTDALTGAEAKDAIDYAVGYVEEYYGYNGYTIEVIHGDAQSTADGAAEAARQLIESNGVDIVVGPTMIGKKAAVAQVCSDSEVPLVFYNPTPESFMETYAWLVGASGTETDLVLDFVIPRGEKGEQGEKGDTGATGATGAAGAAGKDGGSVTAVSLSLDADGHVTGGTATLSDGGTVSITVTEAAE